MLLLMNDVPANVVGVRAVGNVTREDYENVLLPAVERVVKEHGKINFLMVLETDISNFTYGAWMQDARMSLKNFAKWNRIAIVTDQKVVEKLSYVFNFLSPADAKGFPVADIEIAKGWVSAAPTEADS